MNDNEKVDKNSLAYRLGHNAAPVLFYVAMGTLAVLFVVVPVEYIKHQNKKEQRYWSEREQRLYQSMVPLCKTYYEWAIKYNERVEGMERNCTPPNIRETK